MIQLVIENLTPRRPHRFIFICQRAHLEDHELGDILRKVAPDCSVIPLDHVTEGAACTVLLARKLIDTDEPLMIANCDQFVDADIDAYLDSMASRALDGLIMTMTAHDPKWSYVRHDAIGRVTEVLEKQVVSDEATVGIYNYREGRMFARAAAEMISRGERVNGEYYVAPAYNAMIAAGLNVGYRNVGSDRAGMYGLGIPEDLEYFNTTDVAARLRSGGIAVAS
jgi:dTDP-glucose pyrophosphorylase